MTRGSRAKRRPSTTHLNHGSHRHRGGSRRLRRAALFGLVAAACALVAVGAWLATGALSREGPAPKAAIVDQLGLLTPNPTFVEAATDILEQAGYAVDYYPAEEVTVDFYRDLPGHGYELIVLRVHSAVPGRDLTIASKVPEPTLESVLRAISDDVVLFTSEPYSESRYLDEQRALRLFPVRDYEENPGEGYFAIGSDFIGSSMKGRFDQTTVVLMGCSGLASDRTAAAFAQRGAGAVVGWSGLVSAPHTDAANELLLRRLLIDGLPTQEAVARTAAEVGPDPEYGSTLLVYPSKG